MSHRTNQKKSVGGSSPLSSAELTRIGALPFKTPAEVRRFLRRTDGMEDIAAKTGANLGGQSLPGVDASVITAALAQVTELHPAEQALYSLYRRAYESRLAADSQTMESLFTIWRVVNASSDRALIERFQFLGDWIARHRAHGSRATAAPVSASPAPDSSGS